MEPTKSAYGRYSIHEIPRAKGALAVGLAAWVLAVGAVVAVAF